MTFFIFQMSFFIFSKSQDFKNYLYGFVLFLRLLGLLAFVTSPFFLICFHTVLVPIKYFFMAMRIYFMVPQKGKKKQNKWTAFFQ